MAHRRFTDRQGVEWQAWDVVPGKLVSDTLQGGWLAFESTQGERRRLAPVPLYWVHAPEPELEELLGKAREVRARGRQP